MLRQGPVEEDADPPERVEYSDTTSHTDTDVAPDTLYVYRVQAIDLFGFPSGDASDPASVRTPEFNSPATGAPTISGTARVGETLTADTSGIADANGLDNADFTYQWLADDADIDGATGSSYTLADADEGKTVSVRVSFTDDSGNAESLTSAATDPVAPEPTEPPDQPIRLAAAASHDSVILFWEYPADDTITGYRILRRDLTDGGDPQFGTVVEDTGTTYTTYTDDTVEAGRLYEYRILALNSQGASEPGDIRTRTPAAPAGEGEPPTGQAQQARQNVNDSSGSDLDADTTTRGKIAVGTSVSGYLDPQNGDYADWFAAELRAGIRYRIDVEDTGNLEELAAVVFPPDGGDESLAENFADDGETAQVYFAPEADGTYYLVAESDDEDNDGTYKMSLTAVDFEDGGVDLSNDTKTMGLVVVNGPAAKAGIARRTTFKYTDSGTENTGYHLDYDWFRVNLIKGRTYRIDMEGSSSGGGSLVDPYLNGIMDSEGRFTYADPDDNSGRHRDARIIFWPNKDGAYYIWAQGRTRDDEGTYRVRVIDITPAEDWGTRLIPIELHEASGEQSGYCAPHPDAPGDCIIDPAHAPYGSLNPDDDDIEIAGTTYTIWEISHSDSGVGDALYLTLDAALAEADKSRLVLYVYDHERGSRWLNFSSARTSSSGERTTYIWEGVSLPWRVGSATAVRIWVPGLERAIAGR